MPTERADAAAAMTPLSDLSDHSRGCRIAEAMFMIAATWKAENLDRALDEASRAVDLWETAPAPFVAANLAELDQFATAASCLLEDRRIRGLPTGRAERVCERCDTLRARHGSSGTLQ